MPNHVTLVLQDAAQIKYNAGRADVERHWPFLFLFSGLPGNEPETSCGQTSPSQTASTATTLWRDQHPTARSAFKASASRWY